MIKRTGKGMLGTLAAAMLLAGLLATQAAGESALQQILAQSDEPTADVRVAQADPPPVPVQTTGTNGGSATPSGEIEMTLKEPEQDVLTREAMEKLNADIGSLTFKNTELADVIRFIGRKLDLNFIFDADAVQGKVTLTFRNVRVRDALDSILTAQKLALVPDKSGIFRIVPQARVGQTEVETRTEVIQLNWVPATDVATTMKPFLSAAGKLEINEMRNVVIITDVPPNLDNIKDLISKVDLPERQVMIEARLVDINLNALRNLGSNLSVAKVNPDRLGSKGRSRTSLNNGDTTADGIGGAASSSFTTARTPATDTSPQIDRVTTTYRDRFGQIVGTRVTENGDLLSETGDTSIDGQGGAVGTRVERESSDEGDSRSRSDTTTYFDEFGNEVGVTESGFVKTFTDIVNPVEVLGVTRNLLDGLSINQGRGTLAFGDTLNIFGSEYNLNAIFNFLESRDTVTVLANPRVSTLNNVEANIKIVQQVPYISAAQVNNGTTTEQVEFKESGVEVHVRPSITPNGFVRMEIQMLQKIFRGRVGSAALDPPLIDERNAQTNVIVSNGETAVLGGLRQLQNTEGIEAIPWLHRIPVIGWLFKSKNTDQGKTELVLMMTPRIVEKTLPMTDHEKMLYNEIDRRWNIPDRFMDDVANEGDKSAKEVKKQVSSTK